ncbi:hypothetical protein [Arenimonas sp.]|uniref:hypothetical protein n=1 Tax=Arenimonas sp. TaxID=1872635 RepID=UPI0039E5A34B
MNLFRALLTTAFLTGCASTSVQIVKPSVSELAGCYADGAESDSTMLLRLNPDMTYEAYVLQKLNVWGRATGKWYYDSSELLIGPSNETAGWHHYMSPVPIAKSGDRWVLIPESDRPLIKSHPAVCGF